MSREYGPQCLDPQEFKVEVSVTEEELKSLWNEYDFFGEPPRVGTPVMKRLYNLCKSYVDLLTEDVLKQRDAKLYQPKRREIHDAICTMVFGNSRENISEDVAEKITDFASRLVYKESFNDLVESFEQSMADR